MRRPLAASPPLVTPALAGAASGLLFAVLLLRFGDPPGSRRFYDIFYTIALLPVSHWLGYVTATFSHTSELLTTLTLSGALWAVALRALVGRLRRSVRARWVAAGSIVAGTTLAALIGIVGFSDIGPYDGVRGLIFLTQLPGMMLLTLTGYDPYMYDGRVVDEFFRPGPETLLLFSLANALLVAGFVRVARFTWRWIRMPMPRRGAVAEG